MGHFAISNPLLLATATLKLKYGTLKICLNESLDFLTRHSGSVHKMHTKQF